MTLIVTVQTSETIWMLSDRRLSAKGRRHKEDARKMMILETSDGVAMLGYAGLGATAAGTEPADWMSAVLRGIKAPLEHCLSILATALEKQFPRHLRTLPTSVPAAHQVLIPAFVGDSVRLYTIALQLAPDRRSYRFEKFRQSSAGPNGAPSGRAPRVALAGSGALVLHRKRAWIRDLLRLVKACDEKKISHNAVADHLAGINYLVHKGLADGSVGPRCMVVWKCRANGVHKAGGGMRFYSGTTKDLNGPMLPTISSGTDWRALVEALMPHVQKMFDNRGTGVPNDVKAMNADLARIPTRPDDLLR